MHIISECTLSNLSVVDDVGVLLGDVVGESLGDDVGDKDCSLLGLLLGSAKGE